MDRHTATNFDFPGACFVCLENDKSERNSEKGTGIDPSWVKITSTTCPSLVNCACLECFMDNAPNAAWTLSFPLIHLIIASSIVGYKEHFPIKNGVYMCIVLECCDGGELAKRIEEQRGTPFRESKVTLSWFSVNVCIFGLTLTQNNQFLLFVPFQKSLNHCFTSLNFA